MGLAIYVRGAGDMCAWGWQYMCDLQMWEREILEQEICERWLAIDG